MAAADALRIIANAAYRHIFPIRNTAGNVVSAATSLDSEVSTNSGTFADCTNEATEIGSTGIYYLDLTAAEMTATGSVSILVKSTEGVEHYATLPLEPALDSGVAQAGGASSITLRLAASATDDYFNGAEIEVIRGTGSGQVRTITDYTGSTRVATVDRAWATNPASDSVYAIKPSVGIKHGTDILAVVNADQIDGDATAALNMKNAWRGALIHDSIDDATPTTTSFDGTSSLSSTDDVYNGMMLWFTSVDAASADNTGQVRKISDYDGTNKTITLATALPATPTNGDEFMLLGEVF